MRKIGNKEYMVMRECCEFLGLSRSTIMKNICLTKKGLLKPPFPYLAPIGTNKRTIYFFQQDALENWLEARSVG